MRMAQVFRILVSLPLFLLQEMSLPGVADIRQKTWRHCCLLGNQHSARHFEEKPERLDKQRNMQKLCFCNCMWGW